MEGGSLIFLPHLLTTLERGWPKISLGTVHFYQGGEGGRWDLEGALI